MSLQVESWTCQPGPSYGLRSSSRSTNLQSLVGTTKKLVAHIAENLMSAPTAEPLESRNRGQSGHLIPSPAFEFPPGFLLPRPAPLLEEKGNARVKTLVADL